MIVTPRWLLVNSMMKIPKFKIYGFCQHPQNNSRGLLISRHGQRTAEHDLGGYCIQPPRSKSQGKQASHPSSGCTVDALGLKSWGGSFTRVIFGVIQGGELPFAAVCINVSYADLLDLCRCTMTRHAVENVTTGILLPCSATSQKWTFMPD